MCKWWSKITTEFIHKPKQYYCRRKEKAISKVFNGDQIQFANVQKKFDNIMYMLVFYNTIFYRYNMHVQLENILSLSRVVGISPLFLFRHL